MALQFNGISAILIVVLYSPIGHTIDVVGRMAG